MARIITVLRPLQRERWESGSREGFVAGCVPQVGAGHGGGGRGGVVKASAWACRQAGRGGPKY
jgi:hypothetical protein